MTNTKLIMKSGDLSYFECFFDIHFAFFTILIIHFLSIHKSLSNIHKCFLLKKYKI